MNPETGDLVVVPVTVRSFMVDQDQGYVELKREPAKREPAIQYRQLGIYMEPDAARRCTPGEPLELVLRRVAPDDCAMVAGTPETAAPAAMTRDKALQHAAECLERAEDAGGLGDHGQSWLVRAEGWMRLADALVQSSSSVIS